MTQEQFNQDYGRIAMPKPFAHGGLITPIADIGDSTHPVNFEDGFPSVYSSPHSQGGRYVSRGEFNAIGNLATRNDFYKACGGLNTFNAALSSKIGGYPKGAVLQLLDKNVLKYVISLVDNNTVNFNTAGVDGINWMFCYESKHDEVDETYIGSVSESDLGLTAGASVTVFPKEAQRNGIVVIRNFKFTLGEQQTVGLKTIPGFVSSGIIIRTIPKSEGDSLTPLYATAESATPWNCARLIDSGSYYASSSATTPVQVPYLSSVHSTTTTTLGVKFSVPDGLASVERGDMIVIDYINGFNIYRPLGTSAYSFFNPLSFSFDVYII